jgi:hypothetical protein
MIDFKGSNPVNVKNSFVTLYLFQKTSFIVRTGFALSVQHHRHIGAYARPSTFNPLIRRRAKIIRSQRTNRPPFS